MRGFTFLLLSSIVMLGTWGCGSDQYLIHEVEVETIIYPALRVDSFIQPEEIDGYDILWVIDRSGSMGNHDQQLLLGIEEMLTNLPMTTSWRLGIISTDSGEALSNNTFPLVPGDDIGDATAALNALGTSWSVGGEEGFEAVHSYISLGSYSSTWMRNSAALLIVFVSDEDEQSMTWSASEFGGWLSSYRARVFITSIVGLDVNSCADQIGAGYLELTHDFNGIEIDICDEDWGPGVDEASRAYEPIEELELSLSPVVETIAVFIDEQQIESTAWQYDSTLNSVYFLVVPTGGSLVEVVYAIAY